MIDADLCRDVDSAIRSNEIEGHVFTDDDKKFFEMIKLGEITLEQARAIILEDAKKTSYEN